jgi:regulator of sigma E protease
MDLLETILITAVTLGVLVAVHEFGHFWVARRCGVRVLEFSLGFSLGVFPPLWSRVARDGTRYVVHAVPLGGYVKMLDEREGPVAEHERHASFNNQSVGKRIAIVSAGPLANFLLAILAFYVLYMVGVRGVAPVIGAVTPGSIAEAAGLEPGQEIVAVDGEPTATRQAVAMRLLARIGETGELRLAARYPGSDMVYESSAELRDWLKGEDEPDLVAGLGIEFEMPRVEALIGEVVEGSAAERAGLRAGDRVRSVDGHAIGSWEDWVATVRSSPERRLALVVERDGREVDLVLVPARVPGPDGVEIGQAGVSAQVPEWPAEYLRMERYGPFGAWRPALAQAWSLSVFTVDSVRKMIEGLISPKNLSGPITIAKVATASARSGFEAYISFLALLSISLGVLNLLPIPVLDGGHLMFCVAELVRGRPVPERVQMLGYQVGFAILVGVMILALFNDLSRLAAN